MRPLFAVDIDGTLADASRRFAQAGPEPSRSCKDSYLRWIDSVQDAKSLSEDKPVPGMLPLVWGLAEVGNLLYLTSREQRWLDVTSSWLACHGFPQARIAMRAPNDWRDAGELKRSHISIYRKENQPVVILDDDPTGEIEAMAKAQGYTFLKARSGGY